MAKYLLVVPSAALAGREAEYDEWYDTVHLADICALPGVVSGQRFDVAAQSPAPPPAPFLAIYEIESDDPSATLAALSQRVKSGEMAISPALDPASASMWLYQAH